MSRQRKPSLPCDRGGPNELHLAGRLAALTEVAPALMSASAQAESVDPVVTTSSISTMESPSTEKPGRTANAPATLTILCSAPKVDLRVGTASTI